MKPLQRFIAWSEDMLKRYERGDEEAHGWAAFFNLTAISIAVVVIVIGLNWWFR